MSRRSHPSSYTPVPDDEFSLESILAEYGRGGRQPAPEPEPVPAPEPVPVPEHVPEPEPTPEPEPAPAPVPEPTRP